VLAVGLLTGIAAACSSFGGETTAPASGNDAGSDAPTGDDGAVPPPNTDGGATDDADTNDPDLVGSWRFDEGQGTTAHDHAGFPNDGTLVGTAGRTDAGHRGSALLLPPPNDQEAPGSAFVDVGSQPETSGLVAAGAFTIAMWINSPSTPTTDQFLFSMTNVFSLKLNDRRLQLSLKDQYVNTVENAGADQWHHVAATFDHGVVKLFIDGDSVAFNIDNHDAATPLDDEGAAPAIVIGVYNDGYKRAAGMIDEVFLWKRALTPLAVHALAQQ
jgi:hypothetical protein